MSSKKLRSSRDAVLSKLNQKKKALEKSRLRLVTELKRIDLSLKQIQAEYGKIFNDLSPLLNLPTEVTCMIFDLSVASHSLEDPDSKEKSLLPEVVISHVCKQWRDISLNYPRLWTRFFFRANNVESMRNSLDRFDLYIKRSGSQNLELFIDFREDDLGRQQTRRAEQYELMDMAIKEVERWKIVTLFSDLDLSIEAHFAPRLTTASAPNLEYFAYSPECPNFMATAMQWNSIDSLNPTIFQGGAPKLHYLLWDPSTFKIPPFSNITTLRVEAEDGMPDTIYPWKTFLEILSIPSLTNLSMVGSIFAVPESNDLHTIPMNNLKHLRYSDNDYMTVILPFLRAPLLATLSIRNDDGILDDELGTNPFGVPPAEAYSFPSLQTLTLIDVAPTCAESAWRIVQMTQNIKSILISHDDSDDNFFTALQLHGPFNSRCWPMLTTITADFDSWDEIDVIVDFVRSRPKKMLTLRLFNETHLSWKTEFHAEFAKIKARCIVEVLRPDEEAENALMRPMWPPEVDCPDYAFHHDPFEIEKPLEFEI